MSRLLFLFGDILIILIIVWIFLMFVAFFMKSKRFAKMYSWMLPTQEEKEPATYNPNKNDTQEPKP